jgi:hypothetical protein
MTFREYFEKRIGLEKMERFSKSYPVPLDEKITKESLFNWFKTIWDNELEISGREYVAVRSTTAGICGEKLGLLTRSERKLISERGGTVSVSITRKNNKPHCEIVTFREVVKDLTKIASDDQIASFMAK